MCFSFPREKVGVGLLFTVPLIYAIEAIFTLNHLYSFCMTFYVITFTFEDYLFQIFNGSWSFFMGQKPLEQKDRKI